jgi:DNA mismatch repair protein MutS2
MRKILQDLTNCVRPYIEWLYDAHARIVTIDKYRSRAILAMEWPYVCCPEIDQEQIDLRDAIHPMWLREPENTNRAVPLNIQLSRNARMIVLSGPNAGGKSVVLKTLGLFQWMFQVGLPLPARDGSKMRVFQQLMVELGDEQSMDDELSTYSAHLTHLKSFLEDAGDHALVLIDEMGSGTDPHMGGPLAEVVLAELVKRGCWGLITTHYNNLKLLATRTEAMRNAAMGFDVAALRPRYTFEAGRPGSSFAFEIAKRTGLPRTLVDQARAQMAGRQQDVEALLIQLMAREQELADREHLLQEKDRLLDEVLARWNGQLSDLSEKRKKLWEQSRTQARELLMQVRRQAETLLADARKIEGSKESLRQILRQIDGAAAQSHEILNTAQQAEEAPESVGETAQMVDSTEATLRSGDRVVVETEGFKGVIQSIHDREAVVLVGDGFLRLPISRLGKLNPPTSPSMPAKPSKKPQGEIALHTAREFSASTAAFRMVEELKTELDIRGMRAEEAVELLDKVLERALVAGHPSIRVIHGRGGGILRRMVREHVGRQSFVSSFQNEAFDRGGDGVTIVFMK